MTNYLVPVTVNQLPAISELNGNQGMFILPDGSININRKNGTWMIINKQSDHAGVLKPADVPVIQPGDAKWFWAGAGTYLNAGGHTIEKQGILSYDGSEWKELELDISVKSILDFQKTSTIGLVDTYTITFTDGTTFEYEITNGTALQALNTIDGSNDIDAVTGKAVSELMIGKSGSVTDVPLNYTIGKYVDAGGTIYPNGNTDFLTIDIEAGEKLDYSMTMVQGVPPIIFKAEDGQIVNNIEPTSGSISVRTGFFQAEKKGVIYINVRTTQAVIVNYLRLKKIIDIYDEFRSVSAERYEFKDASSLTRVEGSFMDASGVLTNNPDTLHKKIDVKAGDAVNVQFSPVIGTYAWALINVDGTKTAGEAGSSHNMYALTLPISKTGTLYLNQSLGFEDVQVFEINSKVKQYDDTVKEYIDNNNKVLADESTPINLPFVPIIPNAYFNVGSAQIGVTKHNFYSSLNGYSVSQMIRVKAGDEITVSGNFGTLNGIAQFDDNGILAKKLFTGAGIQYTDIVISIESDGFITASSKDDAVRGFKVYNKTLQDGGGSSGVTIYYDRTLRPWSYGLKESNTEAENRVILNNLIFKANAEDRSIELPEGIYKASNLDFKPCHIYGKDRNTVIQAQSANPVFKMLDLDGIKNLGYPFFSGNAGQGNYPGFSVSGFCIDGNGFGTVGLDFGVHAFAKYERLVFANLTQHAIKSKGMLICDFNDIQINRCANGIKAEEQTAGSYYMTNLLTFHRLNIGSVPGIAIDWRGGSLLRFTALDTESCGTTGNLNTGVLFYRNGSQDAPTGQGVIIESSWAEIVKGGFYAKLQGGAMHSIKNSNIKRDGDAQRAIINDGSTLIMENVYTAGGASGVFDVYTLGGGQTMQQGKFTGFHSEATGGTFKTVQYL